MTISLSKKMCNDQSKSFSSLTVERKQAVEHLKNLLVNPPVLVLSRATGHYTVEIDACKKQIGCILLQEQPDGPAGPVRYCSRTLKNKENGPATTHRQCLNVALALMLLCLYREGNRFNVRTDHKALKWLYKMFDAYGILARWRLRL